MGAEGIEPPLNPDVAKESDELRIAAPVRSAETRTGAPPSEDLLGQYIFTTYHLLLKEIRNEAGDTEIVALRKSDDKEQLQEQPDPFLNDEEISEPTDGIYDFPAKKQASKYGPFGDAMKHKE